jgi:hypothetical protein
LFEFLVAELDTSSHGSLLASGPQERYSKETNL